MLTRRVACLTAVVLILGTMCYRNGAANPQDPVVGFETFYAGAGRIDALGITRTGFVKRITIQSDQISHVEDGNALSDAGVPNSGNVVGCVRNDNGFMAIVTETGGIVGTTVSIGDLYWLYVGNVFTMAGTEAKGATITAVTYSNQGGCLCVIVTASDGRVLWGDSQGGQWAVLGNIDDQPVGNRAVSWGRIKAKYR